MRVRHHDGDCSKAEHQVFGLDAVETDPVREQRERETACKAVRMLKLSAELTSTAMQERYPRALLSACTHIARVLGIHCIAKRVDSAAASRWLAVAGVDYLDQFNPAQTSAATTTDETEELQLVS